MGKRIPLRDLRSQDHASIETVLDGTNIFALSIHILSQSPEGECQGQVLKYNPGTRELTVTAALSSEPIELLVPTGTPIVRTRRKPHPLRRLSDLVKGALISAQFEPGNKGQGIARQDHDPGHSRIYICVHGKYQLPRFTCQAIGVGRSA